MNNKRVCRQGAWALMVVLSACACAAEGPIVTNGGFEDVKDGKTVGWNAVGRKYVYVDGAHNILAPARELAKLAPPSRKCASLAMQQA